MWYSGCVVTFPYISSKSPKSFGHFGNIFPPATYWGNPATCWGMSSTPHHWENPAAVGKNKPNRMGHFMIFSIPSLQRVHIPPRRKAVKSSTQTCLDLVWDMLSSWFPLERFLLPSHQMLNESEWLSLSTVQRYHTLDLQKLSTADRCSVICDWVLERWASVPPPCSRGRGAPEALHISHQNEKKPVITIFLKVGTLLVPNILFKNIGKEILLRYRNFHLFFVKVI